MASATGSKTLFTVAIVIIDSHDLVFRQNKCPTVQNDGTVGQIFKKAQLKGYCFIVLRASNLTVGKQPDKTFWRRRMDRYQKSWRNVTHNRLQRLHIGVSTGMNTHSAETALLYPCHEFRLLRFIPLPKRRDHNRRYITCLSHKPQHRRTDNPGIPARITSDIRHIHERQVGQALHDIGISG